MTLFEKYLNVFDIANPYENPVLDDIKPNIQGWNGISDGMKSFITEKAPTVIIEVGTFLGDSAIKMAKHRKLHDDNFVIFCVDTWLGSHEHWRKDMCNMMGMFNHFKNGTSEMYFQFLKNVKSENLQNNIIPIPNTSFNAAKLFEAYAIKADMIYVDGGHTEDEVYFDLKNYHPLLTDTGRLFGDDGTWPSIQNGVTKFLTINPNLNAVYNHVFWHIEKNENFSDIIR